MNNQEYVDTFDEVRACYKKLHAMGLDEVKILHVGGVGKREVATITSCLDFNKMAPRGSVVLTQERGAFLKVTDQHWVTVNAFNAERIRNDADVLLALILEQDSINVLIDPCHVA